ncbi:MAG: hypothetical protein Q7S05_02610 [bacterium]|nr:hypothetical protein [bacterium]
MHNHNNTGSGHGGHNAMMWMMVICCALPLVILFFGGGALFSDGYFPKILLGVFAVACFWMMLKGHGGHGKIHEDEKVNAGEDSKTKDEHKHGTCCH